MRQSLGTELARIEILEYSRYPVPLGSLEFPLAGLPAAGAKSGPVTWKGRVRYAGRRSFAVWAQVNVAITENRVVTGRDLLPGRPVEPDQLNIEPYEGLPARTPAARSLEQVVGRVPRRLIRAGSPVWIGHLEDAPDVRRGDTINIEVQSGATRLTALGLAETPGRLGETVTVRNPQSGGTFSARVSGKGKAVVVTGVTSNAARSLPGSGTRSLGAEKE
jgi:flagella basal body P-ring formation protein FlgA